MRRVRIILLTLAALMHALLWPTRMREPLALKRFLLIPQLTRIGDIVAATPVIGAIKAADESAEILVLVSRKASGILEADPRISLIYYEEYRANLFGLARALRGRHVDAAFLLTGTPLALALSYLARIPVRSTLTRRPAPLLERVMHTRLATHQHRYERGENLDAFYLSMLADAGITGAAPRTLFTTASSEAKVAAFMAPLGARVGIMLSAGNHIKEWGDRRFAELARRLILRGERILLIAGPGDGERVEAVAKELGPEAATAIGFPLPALPSLLKRVTLFISSDTGPLHVAEAMGTPTLDIIGPVMPGELTPPTTRVVLPPAGIAPTIFAFHEAGPVEETIRASAETSVDRVYEAAEALLA